jgi:hypothetical protein
MKRAVGWQRHFWMLLCLIKKGLQKKVGLDP